MTDTHTFDHPLAVERTRFWQTLAQTDTAEVATLTKEIADARTAAATALKDYEPLISDDKDRGMLAADRAAFQAYDAVVDRALDLASHTKRVEARDLLMQNQAIVQAAVDAVETHRQYNKDLGEAGAAEGLRIRENAARIEMSLGILISVLMLAVAIVVIRNLQKVLGGEPAYAAEVMRKVAAGDFSVQVVTRAADHDSLLFEIKNMVASAGQSIGDVVRVMGAVAQCDLTQKIDKSYQGSFDELKSYVNGTVAKLSSVVQEVNAGAESLASASERVSATAQSLSQASSETGRRRRGDQRLDGRDDRLDHADQRECQGHRRRGDEIGERGDRRRRGGARDGGGDEADRTQDRHHRRHRLPDEPAGAQRGDRGGAGRRAGQGFRRGRGRSAQARRAQPDRGAGNRRGRHLERRSRREAGRLLDTIVPNIRKTSDLVQEITAASSEQTSGVGQISAAITQMSQTTQQNAASSEELAATAAEMSSQAEQLQNTIAFFRLTGVHAETAVRRAPKPAGVAKLRGRVAPAAQSRPTGAAVAGELAAVAGGADEARFTRF